MSSNVNPAEAEAIRELLGSPEEVEVHERDFNDPRRFSEANLEEVKAGLRAAMGDISRELADALGKEYPLHVNTIGEISADIALSGIEEPLVALRLDVAGQPGWLFWENAAATRTVERCLGSTEDSTATRPLSPLERSLVDGILGTIADGILLPLGLKSGAKVLAQTMLELGNWRDGGESASPYRLSLELTFDGPGGSSTIIAYLPIERGDEERTTPGSQSLELPAHLTSVELDVGARLGASLVQLDQLLTLEVGDVIPLDAELGDPAQITVQGFTFAHGSIGTHRGRIAIRIDEFEHERKE